LLARLTKNFAYFFCGRNEKKRNARVLS